MSAQSRATGDPRWVRVVLIGATLAFLGLFLFVPLVSVFVEAFRKGVVVYAKAITEENARAAIFLTLSVAALAVPLNAVFGVASAWAIAKCSFKGKSLLLALLYGARGLFGDWLLEHDLQIIFAVPGMVLATVFVTFPFVARELIPLMQAQGNDQEYAALSLGASGWQTFRRVTLPNIKWALFYGIILCNARAMGEFGAVSVVSGHIRGQTNTLPLHVEVLYNEYNMAAAFACASILSVLGLVTLLLKTLIEWRAGLRRRTH